MIVKCEQCQTRFKVPDDKVTEKGVKVRCTKCQHTFRVKRDGSIVPVEAQPADDPFSKFSSGSTAAPAPSSKTPPPEDPFSRFGSSSSTPAPRIASTPTPPPIPSALGSAAAALKNQSGTREFKAMNQTNPKLKKADAAPFDFSALSPPPAPGEERPFDFGNLMPPAPVPQTSTFGRAAPPSSTIQFAGMSASHEEAQPFDFSSLGPPPPAPSAPISPDPLPDFGDPPPDAGAAPDLDFGLPPPPEPQASAALPEIPEPEPEPDAGPSSFGGAKLSSFEGRFDDGPAAPPPSDAGLLGDIPSLSQDDAGGTPDAARGLFFDVPDAPPDEQNQLVAPPTVDAPESAKISVKKGAQPASEAAPAAATTKSGATKKSRGVVATLWNVVSVMFLLLLVSLGVGGAMNEGRAATHSVWTRIQSMFASPGDLLAYDVSNGLYETRVGRPIFYVRGEVKNRSDLEMKHVKVKADILDGDELIRSSEAYVGATPSPEDLYGVSSADDLKQIHTRLATGVASVAPGGTSAFLISFYEYPPDLKDFQVRVSVSPDDGAGAKQ